MNRVVIRYEWTWDRLAFECSNFQIDRQPVSRTGLNVTLTEGKHIFSASCSCNYTTVPFTDYCQEDSRRPRLWVTNSDWEARNLLFSGSAEVNIKSTSSSALKETQLATLIRYNSLKNLYFSGRYRSRPVLPWRSWRRYNSGADLP